jgi:hypothetical protein
MDGWSACYLLYIDSLNQFGAIQSVKLIPSENLKYQNDLLLTTLHSCQINSCKLINSE